MAAPVEPAEVRLHDAILAELERIRAGTGGGWLTKPAIVRTLALGMPPAEDTPGLYLHLQSYDEAPEGIIGEGLHEGTATFVVWMTTAELGKVMQEHARLARDLRRAIGQGEDRIQRALESATSPGSGSVQVRTVGYTYQPELSEKFGLAVGSFTITVRYVWHHDNP